MFAARNARIEATTITADGESSQPTALCRRQANPLAPGNSDRRNYRDKPLLRTPYTSRVLSAIFWGVYDMQIGYARNTMALT